MSEPQQLLAKCDNADYQKEIQLVCNNLPAWKNISSDQITVEKFPFGHSRFTYKITASIPDVEPNPILLRIFRDVDKDEFELFQKLSDIGWGPKCYYRENKTRIEQYFDSTIITCKQINLPPIRQKLVIKLAQLHNLEGLLNKEKKGFLTKILDGGLTMQACKRNLNLDIYNEEEQKIVNEIKESVSDQEVNFLKNLINKYPLVFGHNDIWSGNILLLKNKEDAVLVDFEMMDYNFRGYDVGKLILETLYQRHHSNASYKFLGIENLPPHDEIMEFVQLYLIGKFGIKMEENKTSEELLRNYFGSEKEMKEAVEKFYEEVQVGMLMSGYYSMVLGMRVGKNAGFDLDFFQFAKDGLVTYKEFRKRLFPLK